MSGSFNKFLGAALAIAAWTGSTAIPLGPAHASEQGNFEAAFDSAFVAKPRSLQPAQPRASVPLQSGRAPLVYQFQAPLQRSYTSPLEARIAGIAGAESGRIGVAAVDLSTGRAIQVLGDQPFPMASTSKVAIVATFLEGVDQGRFRLDQQFPLMIAVPSRKFEGSIAPVRPGQLFTAQSLIEMTITRSDNQATDALLAAVGGPGAVNHWLAGAGIRNFRIDRDIATLVRDDGEIDPAFSIDPRDSTTPLAMVQLLSGIYRGQWLRPSSRAVLIGAMERCITGKRRIPAMLPGEARVAHKTGSLNNTSSDVGIIQAPDGRALAVAIYVTGQGNRANREARIAAIAREIYDGYQSEAMSGRRSASR
jgi:beta-lactamase class A